MHSSGGTEMSKLSESERRRPVALAITTARMYPTLKYALGYGKTCTRVTVAGEPADFQRPLALAA